MSNNSSSSGAAGGITTSTVLFIVFLVLKLTHLVDWPWIWVLAPLWIPIALLFIGFAIVILIAAFTGNKKWTK